MPSHYIKILDFLSNWVSGLDGDNWKQLLFDDITGNGRKLLVVPARSTAEGPLVGLCGGRWYCEAGRDRDHHDTLFIARIQMARRDLLRTVPQEHRGSFRLLTRAAESGTPLDSVDSVFDLVQEHPPEGFSSTLGELASSSLGLVLIRRDPVQLGPASLQFLAGEDHQLRGAWRPSARPAGEAVDLVGALGKLWRRFTLDRHAVPEPRVQALLSGRIRRNRLTDDDRHGILRAVDEGVLEALVVHCEQTPWTIQAFLEELAKIPVPVELSAAIWTAALADMDPTQLRRELHEVAAEIREIAPPDSYTWETALVEVLGRLADRNSDSRLQEMLDEASSAESPLSVIGEWAAGVKFEDVTSRPATAPPEEEPIEEPAPPPTAQESDPPVAHPPVADPPAADAPTEANAEGDEEPEDSTTVSGSGEELLSDLDEDDPAPAEVPPPPPPAPPPPPTEGEAPDEAWVRDTVSRWVHLQRFDEADDFEAIRESIQTRARQLGETSETLQDARSLLTLGDLVVEVGKDLDRWKAILPDPATLRDELDASERVIVEAHPVLGGAIEGLIEERLRPEELRQITNLLADKELLEVLPDWIWQLGEEEAAPPPDASAAGLALGLVDVEIREAARVVLGRAREFGDRALDILGRIPPPSDGDDLQGHVEGFLQQLREEERHIQDAPDAHRVWLQMSLDEGAPVDQLRDALREIELLRPRIAAEVFGHFVQRLETWDDFENRQMSILQLEDAIAKLEDLAGTATKASLDQLDNFVERLATPESLTVKRPAPSLPRIAIEHAFVDARGKKVPLVYWPTGDPDRPFGHVSAPFVIRSDRKRSIRIKLGLEAQTSLRELWPSDWDAPHPDEIQIDEHEWTAEERGYRFGFGIKIPVRKPAEGQSKDPLTISFQPVEAEGGRELGERTSFKWEGFERETALIPFNWSDSIDWRNVERHPIGCQQKHRKIEQRLTKGNSFAVLSPRRFGKSTLVQYLCRPDEERKIFVATPVVCTSYYSGARLDYQRIWESVSEDLQEHLGAGITGIRRDLPDNLPGEHAFDHVRKAAKNAGYRGIILLFDEAQLLFPRHEGPVLGNLLKDRLERHWSRPDLEDMAPIQIGLIGLLSMETRAGTNLMGLLRPDRLKRFDEADLNRLILTATSDRLHTTREARRLLSDRTENLYVLKYVLDDLHQLLNEKGQIWADRTTVEIVLKKLGKKLRDGESVTIASYMRDVLNDADDVSQWKPKDCYPTAVALAGAYREGHWDIQRRTNRVLEMLNNWCAMVQPAGLNRLVYTEAQVDQHLLTLRELGIFGDTEFTNRLFAAWLAGRSRLFPGDAEERKVLLDGALERINMPASYEPVHTGTQAEIFRFLEDQKQWALRKVPLLTTAQRERFLETVEMVGMLKDAELRRDEGSQYIYDLRHIGLAAVPEPGLPSNADVGIEIYRWIDGLPLDRREEAFGAAIVAQIGSCLARALRLIHSRNILHRDISPSNVVLSDTNYFPVLIDFGLARLISGEMGTALACATAAPEVRQDNPSWSPAADVFSLGVTLRQLLRPGEEAQPDLAAIIDACTQDSPATRPSAAELVRQLDAAMQTLKAPQRRSDFWKKMLDVAEDDLGKEWFRLVVERHRASFQTLALGLHLREVDCLAEVAAFVDQVLEAYPSRKKLKLGFVKNDNAETGKRLVSRNTDLLHRLRGYRSHYSSPDDERKLRTRFGDPTDEDLRRMVQEGVDEVGKLLSTPTLGRICQLLLEQVV